MLTYTGPAAIVMSDGDIQVMVDLRSRSDSDGCVTWAGHIDEGDRGELSRARERMGQYGLVIRLADGREGLLAPSVEAAWSATSICVTGFLRW
jgi:hypothetical protein